MILLLPLAFALEPTYDSGDDAIEQLCVRADGTWVYLTGYDRNVLVDSEGHRVRLKRSGSLLLAGCDEMLQNTHFSKPVERLSVADQTLLGHAEHRIPEAKYLRGDYRWGQVWESGVPYAWNLLTGESFRLPGMNKRWKWTRNDWMIASKNGHTAWPEKYLVVDLSTGKRLKRKDLEGVPRPSVWAEPDNIWAAEGLTEDLDTFRPLLPEVHWAARHEDGSATLASMPAGHFTTYTIADLQGALDALEAEKRAEEAAEAERKALADAEHAAKAAARDAEIERRKKDPIYQFELDMARGLHDKAIDSMRADIQAQHMSVISTATRRNGYGIHLHRFKTPERNQGASFVVIAPMTQVSSVAVKVYRVNQKTVERSCTLQHLEHYVTFPHIKVGYCQIERVRSVSRELSIDVTPTLVDPLQAAHFTVFAITGDSALRARTRGIRR